MTPLSKWWRNRLEKMLGRYREGQEAPARLREQVAMFASMNPGATRAQWAEFAGALADEAYGSGYIRGVEWAERDFDGGEPRPSPEALADAIDPAWRERPWQPQAYLAGDPDAPVPEERTADEAMAEALKGLRPRRF